MTNGENATQFNTKAAVTLLTSPNWKEYSLLDSGEGKKLEQAGPVRIIRPEAEAIWERRLPKAEWNKASAEFIPSAEENGGHWEKYNTIPEKWVVHYNKLTFSALLSNSKQIGVFPEQACQWDWITDRIRHAAVPPKVLNLFGYTGGASLAAAAAGAKVTHLDASKKAIAWAKENQTLSGISAETIRWITDDAVKFVQREARRSSFYDGIILDPPKFGRGPKGEVWDFYKNISELLEACREILSENANFMLITAYAVKASSVTLYNALTDVTKNLGGAVSSGEVCLQDKASRLLSMAVYGRWQKD